MNREMSSLLRGGRLAETRKDVVEFISSLQDDRHIAQATVQVNEAHVITLFRAKAINRRDAGKLLRALRQLEHGVPSRKNAEDIHILIEDYVTKRTGREVGGQLNLAKSRNDQVVTSIRMVLRGELLSISTLLLLLVTQLLRLAEKHTKSVFPGYTHLQPAQPITFAHYLIAIADALVRDNQRIMEAYERINKSPMGAGALAGSSFKLDRTSEAELLGFEGLVDNTLDAVGSRDFAIEALSACSITAMDISRIAQDLIFYSSADVGLITLPDEFTSTSSIMPQKKNPDPLELVRAKCAKIAGNLTTAITIMHGLASGYNLDFQEITPLLWDSSNLLKMCLRMLGKLMPKIKLSKGIANRDSLTFSASTEIANLFVREEKIPFRTAHRAVGRFVKLALEQNMTLAKMDPKEWEKVLGKKPTRSTLAKIRGALELGTHMEYYRTKGSPNPNQAVGMILSRTNQVHREMQVTFRDRSEIDRGLGGLRIAADALKKK